MRSLNGKRILLTGATGSLGQATAMELCREGAELLLPVRNVQKGQRLYSLLLQQNPDAKIHLYRLDMADEDSVIELAKQLLAENKPLDALIHNAGVLTTVGQSTPRGTELHRQVNALSPLLLTQKLLPLLNASPEPIVLSVTSLSAFYVSNPIPENVGPTRLYATSKRLLLHSLNELSRQHPRITFLYAHPGVSATGLFSGETHPTAYQAGFLRMALPLMRRLFPSPEKACQTTLHALKSGENGHLCEPGGLLQIWGKPHLLPISKRIRFSETK